MISSAELLNSLEVCPKQASLYAQGIERESLSFHQLLSRGINHGLVCEDSDPGKAASDEVLRLACSRPIETEQKDLIGMSEHCGALAEMIVWCLRTGQAWRHPEILKNWNPYCWQIPGGLRRVVLCDRWDERRALQEMRDWRTLEGAIYGLPVTILAVVLGKMRAGRRHGPLAKGWLHPRSREIRFRKRDGSGFDGNWEPVWRENNDGSREDWLQAMTADGVMEDVFVVHPQVEWDEEEGSNIRALALRKLQGIRSDSIPARCLSRCFDSVRTCDFRFPCAYFRDPEEGKGFVQITSS